MMFSSILDEGLLKRAGAEMLRVLAPGGIVISYDMRVTRPDNPDVQPIRTKHLKRYLPGTTIRAYSTTLAPPLANRLCGKSWFLCELLHLLPFLRSHFMAVAQKPT